MPRAAIGLRTAMAFAVALLTTGSALSADDIEPAAASSAGPFIRNNKPCGSTSDVHFCGQITSTGPSTLTISAMQIKYPGAGRAHVTWSGSVYCDVPDELSQPQTLHTSRREFFVNLALKDDSTQTLDLNGDGNATIGETNEVWVDSPTVLDRNIRIWPVTLTKVFDVKKSQKSEYRVLIQRDFRREHFTKSGFCNINGGSTTITFMPNG